MVASRLTVHTAEFVMASLVLLVLICPDNGSAYPRICRRRNSFSDDDSGPFDPSTCKYGWERNACGQKTCTKGPGDLCGGKHQRYGICGEGLMCSNCNRCYGCSLKTFECFEDRNCNSFI